MIRLEPRLVLRICTDALETRDTYIPSIDLYSLKT